MNVCYDENGNVVDFLAERNKEIIEKLEPVLQEFLKEKELILKSKKPVRLGYRFAKQMQLVLSSYGQMSAEQVAKMNYEILNDFWLKYLDLTAHYNRYFEIVDNKQLFMLFCGINDRIYHKFEKSDDEDIQNLMATINSAFVGFGFIASESGNSSTTATKMRLEAKDVGHNVVSATDEMIVTGIAKKSPVELDRELKAILGSKLKELK